MDSQITEELATHCAVGRIGEPLGLRVRVYWVAGKHGALIVLSDLETGEEYGSWNVDSIEPVPGETLAGSVLNALVADELNKWRMPGLGWLTDPVSLAAHFSLEWGWSWLPEKLA
ncbi:hypothetical protein ACFY5K_25605 [Streptomyces griseofuscus]|uniref:hypothetical protein n=1 Tax=Streptomyces griseofuscus TaxID=146922 RepID=UPI0036B5D0B5